jgi:hypothetical protein
MKHEDGFDGFCDGCLQVISETICWCGESLEGHGYDNGHGPIPMGCNCRRDPKPDPEKVTMDKEMKRVLVNHLRDYLKSYQDRGATVEGAVLNYVREFPARLHLVILALLEQQR